MAENQCSNCRFFFEDKEDDNIGICKRYPPLEYSFAQTMSDEWCGEFQGKERSKPPVISFKDFNNGLSVRARKSLARLSIDSIVKLCSFTEDEISCVKNCGVITTEEIAFKLRQLGLNFHHDKQ